VGVSNSTYKSLRLINIHNVREAAHRLDFRFSPINPLAPLKPS